MMPVLLFCSLLFHCQAVRDASPLHDTNQHSVNRTRRALTSTTTAVLNPYAQCGGKSGACSGSSNANPCQDAAFPGYTCSTGYYCKRDNANYWQCQPSPVTTIKTLEPYQQCGGLGGDCSGSSSKACADAQYSGWACATGWSCMRSNSYYWQCLYGSGGSAATPSASPSPSPAAPSPSPSPSPSSNLVQCGGSSSGCSDTTGSSRPCADAAWAGTTCTAGYACTRLTAAAWWCMLQSSSPSPSPSPASSPLPSNSTAATPSNGTATAPGNTTNTSGAVSANSTAGVQANTTNTTTPGVNSTSGLAGNSTNSTAGEQGNTTNITMTGQGSNTTTVPGNGNNTGAGAGNSNNITNSTLPGSNSTTGVGSPTSAPSAPEGCIPVATMSTGSNSTTWWPYVLKQLINTSATAAMPLASPLYNTAGTYGASITIGNASTKAWYVQLSSAPALLEVGKRYTVKFAATASAPSVLQVALVQDSNWQLLYLSQRQVTPSVGLHTLFDIMPLETANYLLNFDLGLANIGTTLAFDDVLVCEEANGTFTTTVAANTQLVAAASTDFEAPSTYVPQLVAPANATVSLQATGAAAYSGQYGAVVTVNQPGTEGWHIQLAGQAIMLNATKSYTVQLALKQSGVNSTAAASNRVTVTWIEPETYIAAFVYALRPGTDYSVFALPPMSPPKDGMYYLTIDFGAVVAGTTLYIDNIKVFEA